MANPMILFYNLDNEKGKKLKMLCLKHKIRIKNIAKEDYFKTVGTLAGLNAADDTAATDEKDTNSDFSDEMMVFCNFTNSMLDQFLMEFKKNRIPRVALKAMLTEQNSVWNAFMLHDELAAEHAAMNPQQQQ